MQLLVYLGQSMRRYLIILAALSIQGCALSPSSKKVEAVGKTATEAVGILSQPASLSSDMRLNTRILANSCSYLRGHPPRLGQFAVPQSFPTIDEQAAYARALTKYVEALASVTNPSGVNELRQAADELAETFGQVGNAAAPVAPAAVAAGPIARVILNVFVTATELRRRHQIRQVIEDVQTLLEQDSRIVIGTNLLPIEEALQKQLATWDKYSTCNLNNIRHDSGEAYQIFSILDNKKRSYFMELALIEKTLQIYQKFIEAHRALVEDDGEFNQIVAELKSIVKDIQAANSAIASLRQ